ncbi:hypothetical protein CMUS01_14769 [Colletotrichum musicola]|uniref:Uncharacterized protein n=1 Tax=Colletotrichum musicola TaxID=2175873 RepID=A0A8H6J1U0_9PEZI|nr:hypothetical protein CMUS01_14769 [Colletotrichum musicola]
MRPGPNDIEARPSKSSPGLDSKLRPPIKIDELPSYCVVSGPRAPGGTQPYGSETGATFDERTALALPTGNGNAANLANTHLACVSHRAVSAEPYTATRGDQPEFRALRRTPQEDGRGHLDEGDMIDAGSAGVLHGDGGRAVISGVY